MSYNITNELNEYFKNHDALRAQLEGATEKQAEDNEVAKAQFIQTAIDIVKPILKAAEDVLTRRNIKCVVSRKHPKTDLPSTSEYIGIHCQTRKTHNGADQSQLESDPDIFIGFAFEDGAITVRSRPFPASDNSKVACSAFQLDDLKNRDKVGGKCQLKCRG